MSIDDGNDGSPPQAAVKEVEITPAMRRLLLFIEQSVIVSRFPPPFSLKTLRKLCDAGLVEVCGKEPGAWGLTRYRLTDAGRSLPRDSGSSHV